MDELNLINDPTLFHAVNIVAGATGVVTMCLGLYAVFSRCFKRKRCVCRVQLCEAISDESNEDRSVTVSVQDEPVADALPIPGEVVRNRVLITQPPPTADSISETITLIEAPRTRRFF